MSSYNLPEGDRAIWKVGHSHISNDIPQMRSGGFQPPFIAGGNQVGYYLGIKSNNITALTPCSSCMSPYQEVKKKIKKSSK
jgi:hypothetical protein